MEFAPGPARPARYPGRRGERQRGGSLDPCAESRLPGWALLDCRLLDADQWFELGNGYRLGPRHGPRPWFALFRLALERHQNVEPNNLKPAPASISALRLQRPLPRAVVAPATWCRWLRAVPSKYTGFPQRLQRPVVHHSACTFGQCPVVQLALEACCGGAGLGFRQRANWPGRPGRSTAAQCTSRPTGLAEVEKGDWEKRMVGDRTVKRKEPRPPIRVEAPLPRWAQVTRAESVVSSGLQVPPSTVASPWAQSDRPKGLSEHRNVVLRTTLDYPLESIPPATAIPPAGRCAICSSMDSSLPSNTIVPACADMRIVLGDRIHLYLWAMSCRTVDFSIAHFPRLGMTGWNAQANTGRTRRGHCPCTGEDSVSSGEMRAAEHRGRRARAAPGRGREGHFAPKSGVRKVQGKELRDPADRPQRLRRVLETMEDLITLNGRELE